MSRQQAGPRGGAAYKFHKRLEILVAELEDQIGFLEELLQARRRPAEFLRLTTALIDALAGAEFAGADKPGESKFASFLIEYSGEADLWQRVSVPDMCLVAAIESEIFHGAGEERYDLAFKGREGGALRKWLKCLGVYGDRRAVGQALAALRTALGSLADSDARKRGQWLYSVEDLVEGLKQHLSRRRWAQGKAIASNEAALAELAGRFRIANLLYCNVRCVVIHCALPPIGPDSKRFWRNRNPYWVDVGTALSGDWVTVEFPARLLLDTLRTCVARYTSELKQRRKLPGDIFYALYEPFEPGAIDVFDEDRMA